VCRRTDTGHTSNGGHVTKFQGGDTNGSGCVDLKAELMHAGKSHNFIAHYCPAKEYYPYCIIGLLNLLIQR